tara:strand:- start:292 stop:528 length:237 start_codon:yes stop_codon:yes gene_type:complete
VSEPFEIPPLEKTMKNHIERDSWDVYTERLEYWNKIIWDMTLTEFNDKLPTWEEKLGLHRLVHVVIDQEMCKEYGDNV